MYYIIYQILINNNKKSKYDRNVKIIQLDSTY